MLKRLHFIVLSHLLNLIARVAVALVTPGLAFVILAAETLTARLLTGTTVAFAALTIARVLATIPQSLALGVTRVDFGTGDL